MRVGLTGGRSLVISSTVLLLGQLPSGTGNGGRSCSVCGAPRPSLTPSSAGVKMGKGRVLLLGRSWCSLTPRSTVPTLKTPEGQVCCFRERASHCRERVSLREASFRLTVCLQAKFGVSHLLVCPPVRTFLSPVLRLRPEADRMPLGAVALPLSLVLLPQTAGQLSSQHRIVALLQDGTERHDVCCGKACLRRTRLGLRWRRR